MAFPWLALATLGGSLAANVFSNKSKKSPRFQQVPTMGPDQIAAQQQGLQMALQGLQNPQAGFEPIEQQELQRFQQQTVPSLAERFTAMGSGGQSSSAFQNALSQGGQDLGTQLAALKANYGLQRQSQLQQLLGLGLQPRFETAFMMGGETPFSQGFSGLSQGLGQLGNAQLFNYLNAPAPQLQAQQPRPSIPGVREEGAAETLARTQQQALPPQQQMFQQHLQRLLGGAGQRPGGLGKSMLGLY